MWNEFCVASRRADGRGAFGPQPHSGWPPDSGALGALRGTTPMSSKLMQFLTDWLRQHAAGRVASAEDIPVLVIKCVEDAAREGISRQDIERAVGSLDVCIRQALLKVKK
jgi:hypothetical protein